MTEKLLQYIWQFQYFNKTGLRLATGEQLQILFPGKLNANQGPDFRNARIRIDETMLAGSVELHVKTSQWQQHGHQNDGNYKNVILHVVFEDDVEPLSTFVPVLELRSRISHVLMQRYHHLMQSGSFIPCANSIAGVKQITWLAWKERLLAERLTRKSKLVFEYLKKNNDHWEETLWWMLARNFGMKVNSEAFEAVAQTIPVNMLAKHKAQIQQVEALLLGQAGLLAGEFKDDYAQLLQREYNFLKKKYGLKPAHIPIHLLRMRPGNFPTIRLAQLAMLVHQSVHLFSRLLETADLDTVIKLFDVTANDYWHYHYLMDEPSPFKKKTVGKAMIDNIVINTVVPMVFSYGLYHKEEKYRSRALQWLEQTTAEQNAVTKGFSGLQLANTSAYDSQAFIELKTQYCEQKRCLHCSIGNALLRM